MEKATLKFAERLHAENFAKAWSRHTMRGHIVGSGMTNVEVILHNVTEDEKVWIDNYINNLNKG